MQTIRSKQSKIQLTKIQNKLSSYQNEKMRKILPLILVLLAILVQFCQAKFQDQPKYTPQKTVQLANYPTLVACYNWMTRKFAKPVSQDKRGCWIGENWWNVYLPSQKQFDLFSKNFGETMFSKMWLANHESNFNEDAIGKHHCYKKGGKEICNLDCGMFQIRDIYGGCTKNLQEQMDWVKWKFENTKKSSFCKWYTGERQMRCVFSRYNGRTKSFTSYDTEVLDMTNWYQKNFYSLTLK